MATDRSRCLRMRFNGNACSRCTARCPTGAITIAEDVLISGDVCSECMLCVAACPADCFTVPGEDFYSVIGRLQKIRSSGQTPVLGCRARGDAVGHAMTCCFGFLSEEHIIALAVFLEDTLQLDVTGCANCRNGFILEALKERIASAASKTSLEISNRVKLIHNEADLDFREPPCDRRGFFNVLKAMTLRQAAGLFDAEHGGMETPSYSAKKVPFKRELLNRALKYLPEEPQRSLLENCYCRVQVDEDCDHCFSCVGMCPTGALKIEEKEGQRGLFFSTALCNACGLCASFCRKRCMSTEMGFFGGNPFRFTNAKREGSCMS